MSYERVIAEHAQIGTILRQLERLIAADAPDAAAATITLSDLAQELEHHLAYEDGVVYPRMIASANAEVSATAKRFLEDFAGLREDLHIFLGEWNSDCIAADWAEFRHQSQALIARLVARIRAENELLYTAALQANAIRLRRAA
ncbi:hemerythrin domain-containing protein [Sphingomonas sp. LB-2]|uniref:hemerythrin domain-containing protein n=1 Tax=Sphingomonas caeni TaxID=2984949 RepID=UPI00222F0630|nr:hemerythrin domain-containing protein [Sphingomonas caeni]MCW3849020.1 hemerythrin domain-containing protein [Sphingomonas caeni]